MEPRAQHVFVKDVQVWGDVLAPGLLLGWRKRKGVWEGWVVVAQLGPQDSGPFVQQRWIPASSLEVRE